MTRTPLAILVVLIVAVLGVSRVSDDGRHAALSSRPGPRSAAAASPAAIFVQEPYMGVSCQVANSIACDRVGLAVWLARPAIVTATIAGAPLRLDDPGWSHVARQGAEPLYVYDGFLHPAGLTTRLHVVPIGAATWLGGAAPTPLVRFRIDYGGRNVVVAQRHVWLHPGWG